MKKENKDIDFKMGTKEEVAWTKIMEQSEEEIKSNLRANLMNEAIIDLAKTMIDVEKEK